MSSPSLSPEELRAAAAVHGELGPDYRDAVLESFLDKVGRDIDARVDARLVRGQQPQQPQQLQWQPQQAPPQRVAKDTTFPLAVISIALGIPITAILVAAASRPQIGGLLVVWLAIAVINVANALHNRPRQ